MTTADRVVDAPVTLLGRPLAPPVDWARSELAARGIACTGAAEETRRRPWSLLARIPTTAGTVWVKANARAFAHEGPLLAEIARLCPDAVPEPLAVQPDRGWLLTKDGGATGGDDRVWTTVVRSYADLQHSLSAHVDTLRATGTPYLPPAQLISVYRDFEHRAPGLGDRIEEAAGELASFGRLSVEHNDLRPGNVFAGSTRLFDWGDAVLTHPFLSMTLLHSPYRVDYLERWRRRGEVTDAEIALAECLAPLVALHPWRTLDVSDSRLDRFVEELVDELRVNFR